MWRGVDFLDEDGVGVGFLPEGHCEGGVVEVYALGGGQLVDYGLRGTDLVVGDAGGVVP